MGGPPARAGGGVRAGVRVLQQQRDESGRTRWADGSGRSERKGTAAVAAGREGSSQREDLMYVLAVIHGESVRPGVFGEAVAARGHHLEEWSLAWGTPSPRPLDAYGAVLVFGGAMHADQDRHHPWLREETLFLERLIDVQLPVLGICLGAQLLARAADAPVAPASEFEIGWRPVELTADAAG